MRARREGLLAAALGAVFLLALVLYLPSLTHGFVDWDDVPAIKTALELSALDAAAFKRAALSFELGTWMPLGWLLYALLAKLGGPHPMPYHAAAVLLHALGAAAVVRFAWRRLSSAPAAALAGLAFAWHPMAVDIVANAAGVADLWTTTLVLWCLALYDEGRTRGALGLFFLACLGRWQAFVAPFGLVLLDWSARRSSKARTLAPFFALAAAVVVIYAAVKAQGFGTGGRLPDPRAVLRGLAVYFAHWAWPARLAHEYGLDRGPLWPAAAAAVAGALLWRLRERARGAAALAAFFALMPLPTFMPMADGRVHGHDRYAYLSLAAAAVGAAWLLARVLERKKSWAPAAAVAACLWVGALGARAAARLDAWSDASSFWRAALAVEPERPDALLCLGMAELKAGRPHEAVDLFKRLARSNPAAARPFLELARSQAGARP